MLYLISVSVILCLTVLGFLLSREKQSFANAISTTVILIVVSVPLAMEVVTTSTMALGSQALSKEGAIVSRLRSIEALAGMDLLCSDKTGTLTQNKMQIQDVVPPLTPPLYEPGVTQARLLELAACATRWNEPAKDALDTLVLNALPPGVMDKYKLLRLVPFDPRHKRTEGTVLDTASGEVFRCSKGAPQAILALLPPDGASDAVRRRVEADVDAFAKRGIRVLAVAHTAPIPAERAMEVTPEGSVEPGVTWRCVGLLSFVDPPRPDTKATLARARDVGCPCKMITGDNVLIAKETASQLGMGTNILLATKLPSLNPDGSVPKGLSAYEKHIVAADGFAQVFPEHKFLIVEVLRRAGYSVGMTGDGVNDAPALKRADIGIAVEGATDAARAAADIVLTQPGLSTIISAIESARAICLRIKAFVIYRVAATLQIVCFFFVAILEFMPSSYALGDRGSSLNVILSVFGDGGRPEGVLALWHAPRCAQRTVRFTEIDAAFGKCSVRVSAASLQQQAAVHGSAAQRLLSSPGVTLDAAGDSVSGALCLEQWPRTFSAPRAMIFCSER